MKRAALVTMLVVVWPIAASAQGSDQGTEAARHFDQGVALTREEAYDAALAEFERAYQLSPSWRIQYNIASLRRQLNDFAGALRAFERYLADGGASVPEEKRAEVEREIAVLKTRVATLSVEVDVPDAEISIDDVPVATSPSAAPIVLNPGRRRVSVSKPGWWPATRSVTVTGGESSAVSVHLDPATTDAGARSGPGPSKPDATVNDTEPTSVTPVIIAWSTTGALFVTSAICGILALDASSSLESERTGGAPSRERLDEERDRTQRLALAADIFAAATVAAAGVSVYLTFFRTPLSVSSHASHPRLVFRGTGASLAGEW